MEEIWKDIEKYEGKYKVSSYGNVKNVRNNKILKFNKSPFYYQVALSVDGARKCIKIHRLVASAFIKNEHNKPEVNHIDGNRYNNRVENLEWVTAKENSIHSYVNGLGKKPPTKYGEDCKSSKLKINQVKEIRNKYANGNYSFVQLAKEYNVSDTNITAIIKRKIWAQI